MDNNIQRLNSILIYERASLLLKIDSDIAFSNMSQKQTKVGAKIKAEVTVSHDMLFKENSNEVKLAQTFPSIMLLSFCVELALKALAFQKEVSLNYVRPYHDISAYLEKIGENLKL